MDIPPELCLELLMAAEYLDSELSYKATLWFLALRYCACCFRQGSIIYLLAYLHIFAAWYHFHYDSLMINVFLCVALVADLEAWWLATERVLNDISFVHILFYPLGCQYLNFLQSPLLFFLSYQQQLERTTPSSQRFTCPLTTPRGGQRLHRWEYWNLPKRLVLYSIHPTSLTLWTWDLYCGATLCHI